jgi:hypothetical protein
MGASLSCLGPAPGPGDTLESLADCYFYVHDEEVKVMPDGLAGSRRGWGGVAADPQRRARP